MLKKRTVIVLFFLSFNIFACEKNHSHIITIRPAMLEDLDQITKISHDLYQNNFKPIWEKYHGKSSFAEEKMLAADAAYENIIENPTLYLDEKLLVAELLTDHATKVVGMCRLDKKENQKIYVHFLAIHKDFRRQGIATHFMNIILNKFNDVTTYEFRTLKDNPFSNNIFNKHDCVKTGESTLDPKTGQLSTDPNLPMIYNNYSYTIKK